MILLSEFRLTTSLIYISIGWEASYINGINSRIFLGSNINSKMYVYELEYENMISIKFRIKKLKNLLNDFNSAITIINIVSLLYFY